MTDFTKEFVRIGKITGHHGLNGMVKMNIMPEIEPFVEVGSLIKINLNGFYKDYSISEIKPLKNSLISLALDGISDRKTSEILLGKDVFITYEEAEELKQFFDDDSFYYYDIIGKEVYLNNNPYGVVVDLMEAGAGEVLIIEDKNKKEIMIPFVKSMVDTHRLNEDIIEINPVDGLIEEQEN